MLYNKPIVISLAGFDPTGGAGVLSDVKTFEHNDCLGMAVSTAITAQTENEVLSVSWLSIDQMKAQLVPLLENYSIAGVKIGIVPNFETIIDLMELVGRYSPGVKIVWDPIRAASKGATFINDDSLDALIMLLKRIDCITPNELEYNWLNSILPKNLEQYTIVLRKGGHREDLLGVDSLYIDAVEYKLHSTVKNYHDKHGSGCILSSALLANVVNNDNWLDAAKLSKKYLEKCALSNENRLAYHGA